LCVGPLRHVASYGDGSPAFAGDFAHHPSGAGRHNACPRELFHESAAAAWCYRLQTKLDLGASFNR
jgi:hypothetical protein